MAPPPAALPEELVEEILLRFPPDEPAGLFRASVVCKPWCRLISGPGFRRRYRQFHRSPPMLGFLCGILDGGWGEMARFVHTSAFSGPVSARPCRRVMDAHHGRVLLQLEMGVLMVVDPVSNKSRFVRIPIWLHRWRWDWNAALLCGADCPCDHHDCHGGPFVIVFVDIDPHCILFVSTYLSDTGTWSDRIFPRQPLPLTSIMSEPCAHVGNALYFRLEMSSTALKYDFCLREISVIGLPTTSTRWQPLVLTGTSTEHGRSLGCVTVKEFKLYMWSRKDGPQVDVGWTQNRVIDLEMLLQSNAILTSPRVVGFANGIDIVFLRGKGVTFTVDLKTKNLKKVSRRKIMYNVVPYIGFYTPALGAACRGGGPSAAGSNA